MRRRTPTAVEEEILADEPVVGVVPGVEVAVHHDRFDEKELFLATTRLADLDKALNAIRNALFGREVFVHILDQIGFAMQRFGVHGDGFLSLVRSQDRRVAVRTRERDRVCDAAQRDHRAATIPKWQLGRIPVCSVC
jgi:hypothetical protein